ncbi:hypothetical protein QJS83_07375 [Bdellovibrio sp. 22V]|uniref:hypothetical protein n=1 Tax=Bdellovibrio sp. 22V TaxID=3044166 RepID=UPI002542F258|nr:hypothetical protein [Bdellovibrio sp. 22V]WII73694.1 hypothetical protein QJS83_07375 [Bdellovibrio sp. 22V]
MRTLITALLLTSLVSPAYALRTVAVKNDRALIDLEGEDLQVGDKLGARDADGKARALLEIKQVKDGRAVAAVIKGRMQKDYSVAKYTPGAAAKPTAKSKAPKSNSAWGFTAGYAMNSMDVKPTGASSISLSGSSFNLSAFYQMQLDGRISARILGGYETLNATGDSAAAACSGSSSCKVEISYLGLEALVRYSFIHSKTMDVWAGAGLGFLFAIGKSSNVLDTSKISTNQTIVGSLGLDYHLSRENFIPMQLDYAIFPDNSTSSAKQIILRAGWGMNF